MVNDEAGALQDNISCDNDEPKSKCSSFHRRWKEELDSADESNDTVSLWRKTALNREAIRRK